MRASFERLVNRRAWKAKSALIRYALTALLERKESEDRYRTILEQIQEGYYEVDLAGSCTFFTAPLSGILGYSEAELQGMNYLPVHG